MKRKITLLVLAALSAFNMNSQVVLSEEFDPTNPPTSNGWSVQNNSLPTGGQADWFPGNPGAFWAYSGLADEYFAVNYQSVPTTGTGIGDISTWLFTPTVTLMNGAELRFAVRSIVTSPQKADRLQILMSNGSGGFTVPTGTASVGTFTTILDINPGLSTGSSSVVSSGSVNGFPKVWTVYTITITGIPAPVTGMFAFRSLIPNGGVNGTNSRYVGLDAVRYTLPCGPTIPSYTICAGNSATISATGGLAATTYSWNTGGTGSSIVVTPTATTVYTLTPSNGTASCGSGAIKTATITIGSSLSTSISPSSATACAGSAVTLTAMSPATSFSWNTGGTSSSIVVSPTTATNYTVVTANGSCPGAATIHLSPVANPTLGATFTPSNICPSTTFVATGIGADFYNWVLSSTSSVGGTTVSLIAPSNTLGVTTQFSLVGQSLTGCQSQSVITIVIPPKPTVNATTSRPIICTKDTATWQAYGATNYTWTPVGAGSTNNPRIYTSGTTTNNVNVSVVGIALGCKSDITPVFTQSIMPGPSVTLTSSNPNPCIGEVVTLTGTGTAQTFTWSGGASSASNPITYIPSNSGPVTFTAQGTGTNGCIATSTISLNVQTTPKPTMTLSASNLTPCVGDAVTLSGSGTAQTFTWSGGATSTANSFTYTAANSGPVNFSAQGTGTNGCIASSTISLNVQICAGITAIGGVSEISVFPNPFSTELKLTGIESGSAELFNTLGQSVARINCKEVQSINTASLPNGVYILKAYSTNGDTIRTMRLVKN